MGCRMATAHRYTYTEGGKVGGTLDLTKWVNDGKSRWIGREEASFRCGINGGTVLWRCL